MATDAMAETAPRTAADAARAAALARLRVLDTPPEPIFDALAAAAAAACGVPIALVSLVDDDRQWFKANVGLDGATEAPRNVSFCDHAIRDAGVFEIADARLDRRFAESPLVTGEPSVRFYAGAPIEVEPGARIGTVCVVDRQTRALTPAQRAVLEHLARAAAAALIDRRRQVAMTQALEASEALHRAIVEDQTELISLASRDGTLAFVNRAYAQHFGLAPEAMVGRNLLDYVVDADRDTVALHWAQVWRGGGVHAQVNRMRSADGRERWVSWTNRRLDGAAEMQSVGRDVTEQLLAERALAASEQRLRRLYESTPAILHSIDAQGRLLAVSDRWLDTLGYTRDEVLGLPSSSFLSPASAQRSRDEVLPHFFETGRCDRIPYQFVHKDGRLLEILLSAILERDADGKPMRSLAVLEDVTEAHRVKAELGRTHARLDAIVDNVPALLGHWDADGVTRFVNREFQAAVGLPMQRIYGHTLKSLLSTVDPEAWPALAVAVADVMKGRRQDIELPMLTTIGLRQLRLSLVPEESAPGQVDGFYGMGLDVTGRKALEQRLSESEHRYRSLFEHLNSGFALHEVIVDETGRPVDYSFLAMNEAYAEMTGIQPERALGRRVTAVVPGIERDPADWIGTYGRVVQTGEPVHFEQRAEPLDRWYDVVAYRPAPGQFAVLVLDVTQRKRAEQQLQEALRDKETLLKEVYHRVKNNLQVVQSLLNLQRRDLPESAARTALDDSMLRVRAMALVHEKLYQSGSLAAVSLTDYTQDLLKQIGEAGAATRRGVSLQADVAPIQTGLDGAIPFGLLVTELVGNAMKHAFPDERGGTVRVVLAVEDGGARLTVRDDGAGLTNGLKSDFDPNSVPGTRTSMGLQLAHSLARQLGGDLVTDGGDGASFSALLTRL